MSNNTNYMRSVNDYSLSAHEIYNNITGNRFPKDTRVSVVKHVPSTDFSKTVDSVIKEFEVEGYTLDSEYHINYDDGASEEEQSQYTIYEQRFYVLTKNKPTTDEAVVYMAPAQIKDVAILELYRRNNELIILSLASFATDKIISRATDKFKKVYKPKKKEKTFYTITQTSHGFELDEMKIQTEYDESVMSLHYNDDFLPVHELTVNSIDDNKRGLILLHGIPGSGKTSYIKQMISRGGSRKIVYIPPHLAGSIANPSFISFVKDKLTNSVLVIEDAEEIFKDRTGPGDSAGVSNLLNISDGILGESLNILIIISVNIKIDFIDSALRRKGRMIGEYYFGELDRVKAEKLVQKLYGEGVSLTLDKDEEITLANIFGMNVEQPKTKKAPTVSFGFTPPSGGK